MPYGQKSFKIKSKIKQNVQIERFKRIFERFLAKGDKNKNNIQ